METRGTRGTRPRLVRRHAFLCMARASFVVCRFSAADDGWRFLNADAGVRNSDTRFSARGEARLSALPPGSGLNFPPNFWHIVSSQRLGENAAAFRNGGGDGATEVRDGLPRPRVGCGHLAGRAVPAHRQSLISRGPSATFRRAAGLALRVDRLAADLLADLLASEAGMRRASASMEMSP